MTALFYLALGCAGLFGECGQLHSQNRWTPPDASCVLVRLSEIWPTAVGVSAQEESHQVAFAAKGSKSKKRKAFNPWPMPGKVKDPLVEVVMCSIGLVVCLILAGIAYHYGL